MFFILLPGLSGFYLELLMSRLLLRTRLHRQLLLCTALTLNACSFQQQPEAMVPDTATAPVATPFPIDTLYALLTAELAANRGIADVALANYMQQAYKTRDIGVTRRASLLARELQAGQATLDAAMLWEQLEPNNPEPVYLVGQFLIAGGKLDLALQRSEQLLALDAQTLFMPIAIAARETSDEQRQSLLTRFLELSTSHKKTVNCYSD